MKTIAVYAFLFVSAVYSFGQSIPTAAELSAKMTVGWNIGNTMEAIGGETAWGNPQVAQRLIDSVKAAGFNTIRIPCSWDIHANQTTYVIDATWIARVKQVVDYCIGRQMYVILNIHWDNGWLENNCTTAQKTAVNKKQQTYWTQISNYFKSYDEHLLFASANEPAAEDATAMSVLLSYHQTFINAVRATGGYNSQRVLIVQGPVTDTEKTNSLMNTMPTDNVPGRLMVEVHYYTPFQYCLMTADASWGNMFYYWGSCFHSSSETSRNPTWGEESFMATQFNNMKTKFIDKGYPVIVGEFGVNKRTNLTGSSYTLHVASRLFYLRYISSLARIYGLKLVYWDPGFQGNNSTTLFDRSTGSVTDRDAVNAIMSGVYSVTTAAASCNVKDCKGVTNGNAYTSKCGQCVVGYSASCYATNSSPVVTITSPASNTSFVSPATIAFSATASDSDGTVTKVEFYNGTSIVGTAAASGSTYSFSWINVSAGTYTITAKATDNSGASTSSAAITVIVSAAPQTYIYSTATTDVWTSTANWTPSTVPTATDTAVIRSGEVKISQDYGGTVRVEPTGVFRPMGYYGFKNIEMLGGTIKVNTSNTTYGMTAAISVKSASTVMSGANPLTVFNIAGTISGSGMLTKTGGGLVKLTASASNFTGQWYVAQDTLTVASATGLGQCGAIVDTAVLDIDEAASTNSVTVVTGGKLNLDANLTVQAAVFDGLNLPAGTYTASNYLSFISGTGSLIVAKSILSVGTPAAGSITLTASSGATYSWSTGATTTTLVPSATGTYTVTASTSAGCAVTSAPVYTQLITLKKGWNLISVNLRPTDSSIATLFNGINANEIKTMDAFWRPGQLEAFNALTTITPGYGYFVNMNSAGKLMVAGTPDLEGFQNLQGLQAGWQLIGCPFQSATPFTNYFNSTNCSVVKNFNGFWVPDGTANSIQDLEPGEGYLMR